MVVTILFPEFIFAHAMEERSMAADALDWMRALGLGPKFKRRWWHNVIDKVGAFERGAYWPPIERVELANKATSRFSRKECHWTYTHAVFANMGGFYVTTDGYRVSTDAYEIVQMYVDGAIEEMPKISKEEIEDKSKADWLVKSLVLAQFLWLAMSLIARKKENLPSSPLEISTFAFTCCGAMTYAAAWHKPKDVNTSINLGSYRSLPINAFSRQSFFAAQWLQNHQIRLNRHYNDNMTYGNYRKRPMIGWMMFGTIIFAGFHCLAWNFEFPTPVERLSWRISTLTATFAPLLLPLVVNEASNPLRMGYGWRNISAHYLLKPLITLIYISSRLCVLSLALASLRAMPPDVYKTTWTRYLISVQ